MNIRSYIQNTDSVNFMVFLWQSILFLLPLCLLFFYLEVLVQDNPLYTNSMVYKKIKDFKSSGSKAEIIILGSSHADNAISPKYSPFIFNLANQGQDLDRDLFVLNLVSPDDNAKIVVITLSYFSLHYNEEKIWPYRVKDYLDAESVYSDNNILEPRKFIFNKSNLINHNLSTLSIIKHLFTKAQPISTSQPIIQDSALLEEHAINTAIKLHQTYFNTSYGEQQNKFDQLVNTIRKQGKVPVIMIPPFHSTYNSHFDKSKMGMFRKELQLIKNRHNITILDYSQDQRFIYRNELFLNSDHLNSQGAEYFTSILLGDLKNASIPSGS